jgi:hypothetical protein
VKIAATLAAMLVIATAAPARADCTDLFVKANAIFAHATVECGKDYMDSPAGYYALAMARQCSGLEKSSLESIMGNSMKQFDDLAKQRGKRFACNWVDDLAKAIAHDAAQ